MNYLLVGFLIVAILAPFLKCVGNEVVVIVENEFPNTNEYVDRNKEQLGKSKIVI